MPFERGKPSANPGGRPKGLKRLGDDVVAAISESFDRVGRTKWLIQLAKDDPKTYAALLAKTIPNQVNQDVTVLVDLSAAIARRDDAMAALEHRNQSIIEADIVEHKEDAPTLDMARKPK